MRFHTVGAEDNVFLWLVQEKLLGGLRLLAGIIVMRRSCGGQESRILWSSRGELWYRGGHGGANELHPQFKLSRDLRENSPDSSRVSSLSIFCPKESNQRASHFK